MRSFFLFAISGIGAGTTVNDSIDLSLEIQCKNVLVSQNEPINVSVGFCNVSKQSVWLDGRMIYKYNVRIQVIDDKGKNISFPGSDTKIYVLPPNKDDFVKLDPGICIFRKNISNNQIRISKPGRYKLVVFGSHGASQATANRFRIKLGKIQTQKTAYVTVKM